MTCDWATPCHVSWPNMRYVHGVTLWLHPVLYKSYRGISEYPGTPHIVGWSRDWGFPYLHSVRNGRSAAWWKVCRLEAKTEEKQKERREEKERKRQRKRKHGERREPQGKREPGKTDRLKSCQAIANTIHSFIHSVHSIHSIHSIHYQYFHSLFLTLSQVSASVVYSNLLTIKFIHQSIYIYNCNIHIYIWLFL